MSAFDALQLGGGLVLAIGYLPQIAQIIRTRSCADLNLRTYIAMVVGIGMMEAYAINLVAAGSGIMFLVTNSISLCLVSVICLLVLRFR